jgi:hypothetical protein
MPRERRRTDLDLARSLIAPHLTWKETALAFICYAIPAASVGREGRPVSRTGRPLVGAAIRVSTAVAIAIRMGHMVGVHVMGTGVCHGAWRKADSKRHDERNPGFGNHDEFLTKSAQSQKLSSKVAAREPLSPIQPFCPTR